MRFWDNLRTAYTLANRVEEMETVVADLQFEWGEIQEKLLTREERLRKRLSRELRATLDAPPVVEPSSPQLVADAGTQKAKRAIMKNYLEAKGG